jgi:hypothetical protein
VTILYQFTPCFSVSLQFSLLCMPNTPFSLTWRSCFFCSWCKYSSTLVPGLLSTVLPLLFHPPQGTPQIKLHIYVDTTSTTSAVPSDTIIKHVRLRAQTRIWLSVQVQVIVSVPVCVSACNCLSIRMWKSPPDWQSVKFDIYSDKIFRIIYDTYMSYV